MPYLISRATLHTARPIFAAHLWAAVQHEDLQALNQAITAWMDQPGLSQTRILLDVSRVTRIAAPSLFDPGLLSAASADPPPHLVLITGHNRPLHHYLSALRVPLETYLRVQIDIRKPPPGRWLNDVHRA
ncbi:MAG: hypothetical protein HC915_08315 [Anaerolineae bacterium]|nr:hypothetical protein [Anaerolineae bacterium]